MSLSKSADQMSKFVCTVCRDLDTLDNDLVDTETSFQFQEEYVQNVSLDDIRKDRNINDGGVACFTHKSIDLK